MTTRRGVGEPRFRCFTQTAHWSVFAVAFCTTIAATGLASPPESPEAGKSSAPDIPFGSSAASGAPQPGSGPFEISPTPQPPPSSEPPEVWPEWVNPLGKELRETDLEWRPSPDIWIRPGAVMQIRYTFNYRDIPPITLNEADLPEREHQITQGFIVRRIRLIVDSHFTEHMRMFIRAGVNGKGDFQVERGYADLIFGGNWRFRAGLFFIPGFAEENPTPEDIIPVDYSNFAETFTSGATEGFSLTGTWDRVSVAGVYMTGARMGYSDILSSGRADFGVSASVAFRIGDRKWSSFDNLISFRGAPTGVTVGFAGLYQNGGDTGKTLDADVKLGTTYVTAAGSGWTFFGQFAYADYRVGADDFAGQRITRLKAYGLVAEAEYFVIERLAPYVRYDLVRPMHARITPFGDVVSTRVAATDLNTFTGGINFFLIPRAMLSRFQLEFMYMLGPIATSIVVPDPPDGVLLNDRGNQWVLRAQWNISY